MDQVVQALALVAMIGATVFGVLALIQTCRWVLERRNLTHGRRPHSA